MNDRLVPGEEEAIWERGVFAAAGRGRGLSERNKQNPSPRPQTKRVCFHDSAQNLGKRKQLPDPNGDARDRPGHTNGVFLQKHTL